MKSYTRKAMAVLMSAAALALPGTAMLTPLSSAQAATVTTDGRISRLGELIVLDNLFGGDASSNTNTDGTRISNLGELIVLDNLFGGGSTTNTNGTKIDELGQLIVLDNLFGGGSDATSNGNGTRISRLGELIVLDNLFGGGSSFTNTSQSTSRSTTQTQQTTIVTPTPSTVTTPPSTTTPSTSTTRTPDTISVGTQRVGQNVRIASVTVHEPAFVVIHSDANGRPGGAIASSALLSTGTHTNIEIPIQPQTNVSYWATIHIDNGDRVFTESKDYPAQTNSNTDVRTRFQAQAATTDTQNQNQNISVNIQNTTYSPSSVTVTKGAKITFTNKDSIEHTVTADTGTFDSGRIQPSGTYSLDTSNLSPGTYTYHCSIHPDMKGTIIVR